MNRLSTVLKHSANNTLLDANPLLEQVQFPKTNPTVLTVADPDFITDLLSAIELFEADPRQFSTLPRANRIIAEGLYKKARTSYFKHSRDNPMPEYKWVRYDRRLKALVLDHYVRSIREIHGLTDKQKTLFASQATGHGHSAISLRERDKQRLDNLAQSIVTQSLFEEDPMNPDEDYAKQKTLAEMGRTAQQGPPTATNSAAAQSTKLSYGRKVVEWKNTIITTRSICSDLYCWVLHTYANKHLQSDLEQAHSKHLKAQSLVLAGQPLTPFHAGYLVAHMKKHYTTDNTEVIENMTRVFEKIIRYKFETIKNWLDRIVSEVDELIAARDGLADLDDAALQKLWKVTFGGNISTNEILILDSQIPRHIDDADCKKVSNYAIGDFDPSLFRELCIAIEDMLPRSYDPDQRVLKFNQGRYDIRSSTGCNGDKPDYSNPVRKRERDNSGLNDDNAGRERKKKNDSPRHPDNAKHRKAQRPREFSAKKQRTEKAAIPLRDQCKTPSCVLRKNHTKHTHAQCFYKEGGSKNVSPSFNTRRGQAGKHSSSSSSSGKYTPSHKKPQRDLSDVECYNCHKKGHYAGDCPMPKSTARFDKKFTSMLAETFPEPELANAVNLVLDSMETQCCHNCLQPHCNGNSCNPRHRELHDAIPEVMRRIQENPDLADSISRGNEAYSSRATCAPLTVHNYFSLMPSPESVQYSDDEDQREVPNFFTVPQPSEEDSSTAGGKEEEDSHANDDDSQDNQHTGGSDVEDELDEQ